MNNRKGGVPPPDALTEKARQYGRRELKDLATDRLAKAFDRSLLCDDALIEAKTPEVGE